MFSPYVFCKGGDRISRPSFIFHSYNFVSYIYEKRAAIAALLTVIISYIRIMLHNLTNLFVHFLISSHNQLIGSSKPLLVTP